MSQVPPPPSGGFPQPGGPGDAKAQAAAAKAYAKAQRPWYKKKRFIIPLAIVVIAIIASAAGSGGSSDDDKKASDKPTAEATNSQKETPKADETKAEEPKEEPKEEEPDNSSKGKGAITWGNWEVVGKIQVTKDPLDSFGVVARVRNIGDGEDTGFFTVTILKGDEILGTADCSTSEVAEGAVATANCVSIDTYKAGFTEVTIENSF